MTQVRKLPRDVIESHQALRELSQMLEQVMNAKADV
jgi:hypothetical protein